MRVITILSGERESRGVGHDGVNTRAKACRSAVLFLRLQRGRKEGEEKWDGGREEEVV